MTDLDFLETRVIGLENELRQRTETLRDRFAAAALTGLLAKGWTPFDQVSVAAFQIADLMLEARK